MISELSDIKDMRKKFGLTQSELAKRSGVSQSLIAKIEAGRIDPTYTNVRKIFEALTELGRKNTLKVKDVMGERVISVSPEESIENAIRKMRKFGISQMPVISDARAVGILSETDILNSFNSQSHVVSDIMQEAPPLVSSKAPIELVIPILRYTPMVLVAEDGHIKGIITKSDVLAKAYSYRF